MNSANFLWKSNEQIFKISMSTVYRYLVVVGNMLEFFWGLLLVGGFWWFLEGNLLVD